MPRENFIGEENIDAFASIIVNVVNEIGSCNVLGVGGGAVSRLGNMLLPMYMSD